MAIYKHPSKANTTGFRVYDKSLGVSKYFPLSKEKVAIAHENSIQRRKANKKLINELSIKKIFSDEFVKGVRVVKVNGLSRVLRKRKNSTSDYLFYQISINGKQRKFQITIYLGRTFEQAWSELQQRIYELHGIEKNLELIELFKLAKRNYWNRPVQSS